jgi:hypothetical protein
MSSAYRKAFGLVTVIALASGCSQILGIQDVPVPEQGDAAADAGLAEAGSLDGQATPDGANPFCVVGTAKVGCIVK